MRISESFRNLCSDFLLLASLELAVCVSCSWHLFRSYELRTNLLELHDSSRPGAFALIAL